MDGLVDQGPVDELTRVTHAWDRAMYLGRPFHFLERVSCVFVKQEERWVCVLTHLSEIAA